MGKRHASQYANFGWLLTVTALGHFTEKCSNVFMSLHIITNFLLIAAKSYVTMPLYNTLLGNVYFRYTLSSFEFLFLDLC